MPVMALIDRRQSNRTISDSDFLHLAPEASGICDRAMSVGRGGASRLILEPRWGTLIGRLQRFALGLRRRR